MTRLRLPSERVGRALICLASFVALVLLLGGGR